MQSKMTEIITVYKIYLKLFFSGKYSSIDNFLGFSRFWNAYLPITKLFNESTVSGTSTKMN